MKKSAFTMIELIFVIVILGILAAVAVPRLAGVQDDALVATEESGVGAIRSGIQAVSGKILINPGQDVNITAYSSDGTKYYIEYEADSTDVGGITNNKPIGLSAGDGEITEDAGLSSEIASENDEDKTFAAVLEAGSDRGSWKAKASDTTNTQFVGKASSSLPDDSEAKLNQAGSWIYRPSSGSVTWDSTETYE
ncbi:MAG: type II secretion system protein [Campylobacterales bacterium]